MCQRRSAFERCPTDAKNSADDRDSSSSKPAIEFLRRLRSARVRDQIDELEPLTAYQCRRRRLRTVVLPSNDAIRMQTATIVFGRSIQLRLRVRVQSADEEQF